MTPRERLLTALSNDKPDHVPAQVHGWMGYYLDTYLNGCDQYEAYRRFGMDSVIYAGPRIMYADKDRADWVVERTDLGADGDYI